MFMPVSWTEKNVGVLNKEIRDKLGLKKPFSGDDSDTDYYIDLTEKIRNVAIEVGITNMIEVAFYLSTYSSKYTEGVNVWVEKTIVSNRLDREQGDFGKSTRVSSKRQNRQRYLQNMRLVKSGDIVFHLINDKEIVGVSKVLTAYDPSFTCLKGTEWDDGTGKGLGY